MDPTVKRVYQVLILGAITALLLILALANPIIINSSDFSIYNPSWNGCSNIAIKSYKTGKLQPTFYIEESELTLGQNSFVEYDLDSEYSCILIIGPRSSFTDSEISYIRIFLNNGGLLFLADDFGTGNELLKGINATSRFSGNLLIDLSFEKSAEFVTVFDFQNFSHPFFNNVTRILFNYPTSINMGKNAFKLASSSELSWIDKNLNEKEDAGELKGPFPVIVIEDYGEGQIVLLSDPSVLINSMKNQLDNKKFIENLLNYFFKNRNTILIDESHRDVSTPWKVSVFLPSSISFELKIGIILLVIFVFIFFFTSIPQYIFKRFNDLIIKKKVEKKSPSDKELIKELLSKHPSWKKAKLEEILRGLE